MTMDPPPQSSNTTGGAHLWEKIAAFVFGVIFVTALLSIAIVFPEPTPFQYQVFRIILALACAGVAAVIPGLLDLRTDSLMGLVIRAGGALAVFVLVYLVNPAQLVVPAPERIETRGGVAAGRDIQGSTITITRPNEGSGEAKERD